MWKYLFWIWIWAAIAATVPVQAQTPGDPALARAMDSIFTKDQRYRLLLYAADTNALLRDSVARAAGIAASREAVYNYLIGQMSAIDAANFRFLDSVIKKRGYPGKTLLGSRAYVPWLIIHHADAAVLARYMPVLKDAAETGELLFTNYAYSVDRMLAYQHKEQRYGSQIVERKMRRSGQVKKFIWPLEAPAKVNERRKAAGFQDTIEEYARANGITYQVVKMGDFVDEEED